MKKAKDKGEMKKMQKRERKDKKEKENEKNEDGKKAAMKSVCLSGPPAFNLQSFLPARMHASDLARGQCHAVSTSRTRRGHACGHACLCFGADDFETNFSFLERKVSLILVKIRSLRSCR